MSDRNATPIAAACSSGGSNSSTSLSVEDNVAISGTAGPPVVVDRSLVRFLETPDIPLLGSKKLTPRQRWGIDVSEPLIATAKCYVFKLNMPQWAKLYIFGRRVCFRTLLSVGPLKVSDSRTWDEIDGVEGEDGVLLNSMRIVYKDGTKAYLAFELPEERVRLLAVCEQQLRRQRAAAVNGVSVPQTPQEDITSDVDDEEENDPAKIADTASVGASFHLAAASASTDRTGLRILKGGRPKHMTILTIGSRGDVQPFISLGKTLQKRGYNVRIASFAEYQPWVESHGIEFRVVAGDAVTVMSLCVDNGMFTFSFIKGGIAQLDWIKKLFETAYEATEGTDLILLTQSAMIGANLGAARGVPVMHVFTMPWSATKDFPHPFLVPEKDKGAAYNLSSWKLVENGMGAGTLPKINEFRKAHKLPATWPQGPIDYSLIPTLYCFSEHLVPKPSDWCPHTHNTGFWFLDNPDPTWTPPADLVEFMVKARKDGKKIVYIGFGSIVVQDPEGMSRAIVEAVERAGVCAIVSEGWSARGKKEPAAASTMPVPPTAAPERPPRRPAMFLPTMTFAERATEFLFGEPEQLTNHEAYVGLYQILSDYSRLSTGGKANTSPISPSSFSKEQISAMNSQALANQPVPTRGILLDDKSSKPAKDSKSQKDVHSGPLVWPDSIYKVKAIPHDWLFPQLDGVVHHGGAGSTAAGLRAGCPTVIRPFFGDQDYWGLAIESRGLGVVVRGALEPESLAEALVKVTTDAGMRERAQAVGEKLRSENGPETAADLIEKELDHARNLMEDLLVGDHEKMQLRDQRKALVKELQDKKKVMDTERAKIEARLRAQGVTNKAELDTAVKEQLAKSMSFALSEGDPEDEDDDEGDDLMRMMTDISISSGTSSGGAMSTIGRKTGRALIKATVLGAGLVTTAEVFGLQIARNAWSLVVGGGKKAKATAVKT